MPRQKYEKVTEGQVFDSILNTCRHWESDGIAIPIVLASQLNTSRYQINKHIKSLKAKGLVYYAMVIYDQEYDPIPPSHGYKVSKKGHACIERRNNDSVDASIYAILPSLAKPKVPY